MPQTNDELVEHLKQRGYIKSKQVETAFLSVPREQFVPSSFRSHAYADTPLEIGEGQTISAPHMVAIMCEALDLESGQQVLEIGAGSGYHVAIISKIIGDKGHVYTVERLPSLADKAKKNLQSVGITSVTVEITDGSEGLPDHAPYDRIYVTCSAPKVPPPLIEQLKENGKLLIPVGKIMGSLKLVEKQNGDTIEHNICGCAFVPLKGKHGY